MGILSKSLAQMANDKSNKTTSPVWKKVQVKEVASYKTIFTGVDDWDKVDEMVAIGRRIYERSEVEASNTYSTQDTLFLYIFGFFHQVGWLTNLDEVPNVIRLKALDLKEIAETFGLWDVVYKKDVVKELEAVHVTVFEN